MISPILHLSNFGEFDYVFVVINNIFLFFKQIFLIPSTQFLGCYFKNLGIFKAKIQENFRIFKHYFRTFLVFIYTILRLLQEFFANHSLKQLKAAKYRYFSKIVSFLSINILSINILHIFLHFIFLTFSSQFPGP